MVEKVNDTSISCITNIIFIFYINFFCNNLKKKKLSVDDLYIKK